MSTITFYKEILIDLRRYVNSVLAEAKTESGTNKVPPNNIQYSHRDNDPVSPRKDVRYSLLGNDPLEELISFKSDLEPGFVASLIEEIDKRGLRDSAVYKAAGIDRRLFSKIKSDPSYRPSKDTCVALAMALKLNIEEASRLLSKAGFAFSHSIRRDIILEYFFKKGIYDLDLANSLLDSMGEKTLGR